MRCAGPSTPRPFALRWASRGGTPAAGNRWSRRSPSRRSSPPRNSRRREGGSMSDANHDPFGLGGRQDDDADARVLALFHDWLSESRETDRHCPDEDKAEYDAALKRREEFETEIISIPGGATASAIKAYLYLKVVACGDWAPEDATLRYS